MKTGKTLAIGCGSVVGLGVLGLLGGWFFFVRAPSPETQCDHLISLMKKESGRDLGDKFRTECIEKAEMGENEGLLPYAERARCVVDSETLDQASKCGKSKS
jgi:hypothetical protein